MTIETKDLWQSAYLLSEGGWLAGVKVQRRTDGKREVIFRLTGEKVEDLAQRFMSGQAVCNVTRLKAHVNHLKDVIFGSDSWSAERTAGGTCSGE
jgi:hypothetical protein